MHQSTSYAARRYLTACCTALGVLAAASMSFPRAVARADAGNVKTGDAGDAEAAEQVSKGATCSSKVDVLKEQLGDRAPLPLLGGLALPGFTDAGPTCEEQLTLLEALARRLLSCEQQLWNALPERPWDEEKVATGTHDADTGARDASAGPTPATAQDAGAARDKETDDAGANVAPKFQILIASIPSPRSAGSANLVDPALEGILAAAAERSYLLDRS